MKPTNETDPNADPHPPPSPENAATERQLAALRSFHCLVPEGLAYEDARAWLDVLVPKAKRHEHISEDDLAGPPLRNAATGRPSAPTPVPAAAKAPPSPPRPAEAPRSLPLLAGAPVGRSGALAGLPAATDANGHGKWSVSLEIHASEDPAQCKRVVKVSRLYLDSAEEAFALVPALEALGAETAAKGAGA